MAWPDEAYRMPVLAETGEFIPVLYSTKVINHVRSNLVAVATSNTTWKAELAKGDQLQIAIMTTTAATDVDPQSSFLAAADAKAWSTTPGTINIEYWKENPIMIDDSTAGQTHITGLMDIMAGNAAYGLEKAIDTTVNTLYSSTTSTWAGSDGQTFDDNLFIALQEGLDEGDVPRRDRSLVGDPSMIADIYKIDKFMSTDYSNRPFTTDGWVGMLPAYNVPVFVSNNLVDAGTGNYGILMHKDCLGVVIQSDLKVERFRVPWQHSDGVNVSAFYGCAVLRATFGAYFYTRYN